MADVNRGATFTTEIPGATELHNLVDNATVTNIVDSDISNTASISADKIDLTSITDNIRTSGDIVLDTSAALGIGLGALDTIDSSSVLDIRSTTKGVLLPRMTTTQRNAISSPATGLTVYDTDNDAIHYYDGSEWNSLVNEVFAEMYIQINSTWAISTADTWTGFSGASVTEGSNNRNVSWNSGTKSFVIDKPGIYSANLSISFVSGNNNEIQGALEVNGSNQTNIHFERTMGGTATVGSASFTGFFSASASDTVRLVMKNVSATTDITVEYMNLNIRLIESN